MYLYEYFLHSNFYNKHHDDNGTDHHFYYYYHHHHNSRSDNTKTTQKLSVPDTLVLKCIVSIFTTFQFHFTMQDILLLYCRLCNKENRNSILQKANCVFEGLLDERSVDESTEDMGYGWNKRAISQRIFFCRRLQS